MDFFNILFDKYENAKNTCIGLIGGGGKTTLLFRLGQELSKNFQRVLLTSITKAGPSPNLPIHLRPLTENHYLEKLFDKENPLYLLDAKIGPDKYRGINTPQLAKILSSVDVCVVEADGARSCPLKVHMGEDPILPDFITHAIILIGADAVNTKLNGGKVHRPDQFRKFWHLPKDAKLTPDLIAHIVTHPKGYLSRLNSSVTPVYFINKADLFPSQAVLLSKAVYKQTSFPVYYGSITESWWKQTG